jgi:hypothetical protein
MLKDGFYVAEGPTIALLSIIGDVNKFKTHIWPSPTTATNKAMPKQQGASVA